MIIPTSIKVNCLKRYAPILIGAITVEQGCQIDGFFIFS